MYERLRQQDSEDDPCAANAKPSPSKYYYLAVPAALATALLLMMNAGFEISFRPHGGDVSWDRVRRPDEDFGFFIRTEGCSIPAFDPFDASIKKYVESVPPIVCSANNVTSAGPLVDSDERGVWVRADMLDAYGVGDKSLLRCCYRPFFRVKPGAGDRDEKRSYGEECYGFGESFVGVEEEFVRVECSYNGTEVYKDFHAFVRPEFASRFNDLNSTHHRWVRREERFNVLVLGLDAVSRLNLYRTMPKTIEFLKSLGVVDLRGYNKVGDNTYPNLIPVLSGLSESELATACLPSSKSRYDDCPFVWRDFADVGYRTAYAEDAANIGLFNYGKRGFLAKPTDYYWRTFDLAAEDEIGHEKRLNAKLCVGSRLTVDVLLDYVYKFVKSLVDHVYFGFFWETSVSHDYLNYPMLVDENYRSLLHKLKYEGLLEMTVLVLMSDHGIRWGSIRSTHQGRMEERLPFVFIVLPDSFKEQYPLASAYLRSNSKRLTTPFDLHETLKDLSDVTSIGDAMIRQRMGNLTDDIRGISLFLPVGVNRTCEKAAIDTHWCTCHETRKLDVRDSTVVEVANLVVDHINAMLKDYVQCSVLNLTEILDGRIAEPYNSSQVQGVSHVNHDYTVSVRTEPGGGVFESTVRRTVDGWNITGTISRLNLYGKKSYCVDDFHLKLYCYCDNPIPKLSIFNR